MFWSINIFYTYSLFFYVTEPANLYFQDVREDYFDGFHEHLHPFYKAKDGAILDYDECTPEVLYKEPLYSATQQRRIAPEAQKLLMYSNRDYEKVKAKIQKLNRVQIPVSNT